MNAPAASAFPIPRATNAWLVAGVVALHGFVLAALPLLLPYSPWWAAILLPLAIANSMHWALIHEGIHKLLHPDAAANERASRLLGVLMGASFHVLRFGHLMHHQLNRDWHSEWVGERNAVERLRYYAHLLFGLYGSEVATSALVAALPREAALRIARRTALKEHPGVAVAAERFFYRRGHVRFVRQDMLLSALLFGAAFWHFGAFWPVLALFLLLRALVVSLLDNIYHYGTSEDNSKAGKELLLSPFYARLLLHGNYHETHHLNPQVPWTALPQAHDAQGRVFDGRFVDHGLRQFDGPLQSRRARRVAMETTWQAA